MKLTVTFAVAPEEIAAAETLTKSRYSGDFGVDLSAIKESSSQKFEKDTLIIRDENGAIVATLTMMYPENGILYPTEDLFGMDIRRHIPHLHEMKMVEVGRVAKLAGSGDGELIMSTLMLATTVYLQILELDGWIATVKKPMLRFLRKKGLRNLTMLTHPEGYAPAINEEVRHYLEGHEAFYFMATSQETASAFHNLYQLVEDGVVTLDFVRGVRTDVH